MGTEKPATSPFSDEQIALAAANYEAQEHLMAELRRAFEMSGMSLTELGAQLGLSVEDAEAWITGEMDLTLSELRQLANCVDARIDYRVGALRTTYAHRFDFAGAEDQWLRDDGSTTDDEWSVWESPDHQMTDA